jgi:hypothetical protein
MKLKLIALGTLTVLAGLLSGCVTSLDGRQTAGIPFVKDKIEARYERSPMEIWSAAKEVLNFNGKLYSEDVLKSTLEASVNERTVWVKIEPVDQTMTRVIVQARTKGGGTDVDLASEIDKQIALRLVTGSPSPSVPANARRGT